MSEATYEDYQEEQYGSSGGYDGPPIPAGGYFPPEFRIPVGHVVQQSPIGIPAPPIFPTVVVTPPAAAAGDSPGEIDEDSAVPEEYDHQPIDPWLYPRRTVYESAPGGIYETNRAETDWERVYDEYVVLNAPEEEEVPVHHTIIDWGVEVIGGIAGGILDPVGIGEAITTGWLNGGTPALLPWQQTGGVTGSPGLGQQTSLSSAPPVSGGTMAQHGCPPYGPKYGKICLATGVVTPLRRRRRRRLLTSSDIKDLSALKSIVGGAALQAAVTQAVRR